MKKFCLKVLNRAAIYFTVATMIFSLFVLIGNAGIEEISLDPIRVLSIFPFCLFFAIANTTVGYKKIGVATRWIIHAVLTVVGAYLFLILPAELGSGAGNFMGFSIIIFAYVVGILIYALVNRRIKYAIAEDKALSKSGTKK